MASLNGKPVRVFRRWWAQIEDKSCLNNVWDYWNNSNQTYTEYSLSDIKDKIKSVYGTVQPGQTLYFGKTSKFPRFKLSGSDLKRCIKPEKGDLFVISNIEGREKRYEYFLEDEVSYYAISQEGIDSIRCIDKLIEREWKKDPIKYIKENLLYGASIISERTNVTLSYFKDKEATDVINIMNGTYKSVISDQDLDKAINSKLDEVTEDDLQSITDLLDSPDQSSQGLGLKMLGALNINEIPLTVRTLIGFRRYLASCPEWKSVGVRNMLETIKFDDFGSFEYLRPIMEPHWKKQTYNEHDLSLCRNVYLEIVRKTIEENIKRLENSEVLNTFGIKIEYEVS